MISRWQHLCSLPALLQTSAPPAAVIIRAMVGAVFLSEGMQKFLYAAEVGSGRFARIGLPSPELLGPLVGSFEVVCGAFVLAGLFTRVAVLPLLVIMAVAITTTKIPILLEDGFWKMAHASRNDFCMVMGSLFLLIAGSGRPSLDVWILQKAEHSIAAPGAPAVIPAEAPDLR
jgi:putative oxidoreductase